MQNVTNAYKAASLSLRRTVKAQAKLYSGNTLIDTFQGNKIVDIEIQRTGEDSKFFGFPISQKATITLLDKERELNITTDNYFQIQLGLEVGSEIEYKDFPNFYVKEVTRDENNNQLSIVAYDCLEDAKKYTFSDLNVSTPYYLNDIAVAATKLLCGTPTYIGNTDTILDIPDSLNRDYGNITITKGTLPGTFIINGTLSSRMSLSAKFADFITFANESEETDYYSMSIGVAGGNTDAKVRCDLWDRGFTTSYTDDVRWTYADTEGLVSTKAIAPGEDINLISLGIDMESGTYNNTVIAISLVKGQTPVPIVTSLPNANLYYEEGANLSGGETVKDILNDVSEITQTIYYVDADNKIVFKKLDKDGAPEKIITKAIYSTLTSENNHMLQTIVSATELGDNVSASASYTPGKNKLDVKTIDVDGYGMELVREEDVITLSSDFNTRVHDASCIVDDLDSSKTYTFSCKGEKICPNNYIYTPIFVKVCVLNDDGEYEELTSFTIPSEEFKLNQEYSLEGTVKGYSSYKFEFNMHEYGNEYIDGVQVKFYEIQLEEGDTKTAYKKFELIPGPGETQYIRDNDFLDLREDRASILEAAVDNIAEISAHVFELEWRGDPALEPGDKIAIITKDDNIIYSYLLDDVLTFNGGLREKTQWKCKESENVSGNPTSLGDILNHTYARVNKANKEISLLAAETNANNAAIASLQINTESINASVTKVEQAAQDAIASLTGELATVTKKVETSMTAEDVQIQIKTEISNGVDKVVTATGFTFDESGLNISKTGSEMRTNIDEDGMSVFKNNEEVLTADNTGVYAYNLHARTYLIVGNTSRFEDFTSMNGEQRTGCFWIGG